MLDETVKALVDSTATTTVIDIVQVLPWFPQVCLRHSVRVVRVVRCGRERHVHGHLLVETAGAHVTVASASSRPSVHQQWQGKAMC